MVTLNKASCLIFASLNFMDTSIPVNISLRQEPLQLKAQMGEEAMAQAGHRLSLICASDGRSRHLRNEVYWDTMQGCSNHLQSIE